MAKKETAVAKETLAFQAETTKLLDLMIHSIYTHKEIFLRELVSNASDALDKIRFMSLTDNALLEGDGDFHVFIEVDQKKRTLTLSDNGIGMTRDEIIQNLGTIAKSGSKAFIDALQKKDKSTGEMNLIGQFGVGFYSAFMVAEKVKVITKAPKSDAVVWESKGDGKFTVEAGERLTRGTTIILTLRKPEKDEDDVYSEYLNEWKIKELVKKYSDYIRYPIKMDMTREEIPKDEEGKPIKDAKPETVIERTTLNSMKALWERAKSDIKPEEYNDFYRAEFHGWDEPSEILHTKIEGVAEYTAMVFIPSKAPFNFFTREYKHGLKLYCRNVFIMENCEDILPEYLGFVKGLVDSPDFPLNISREILQHTKVLKTIGTHLEKKIIDTLKNMQKENRKKYEDLFNEFGPAIKSGVYTEYGANKEKLEDLLMFPSSFSSESMTSLAEYVERMKDTQESIYYITGKDRESVERLPQMELVREKGYEVLYLLDRVDEFTLEALREYKKKKIVSVSRGEFETATDENEKKEHEKLQKDHESLLQALKESLGDRVAEVKLSSRLKTSAVCIVSGDGISLNMERVLEETGHVPHMPMKAKKILELNPDHQLFSVLTGEFSAHGTSDTLKEYAELLYDQALIMEGIPVKDPVAFANRVATLMVKANG